MLSRKGAYRTVAYQWTSASGRYCGNMHLASRWLAMDCRSGSAIPAFRHHVKILYRMLFCFQRFLQLCTKWSQILMASDGPGQHRNSIRAIIYILTA
jgi:hypothetical protein